MLIFHSLLKSSLKRGQNVSFPKFCGVEDKEIFFPKGVSSVWATAIQSIRQRSDQMLKGCLEGWLSEWTSEEKAEDQNSLSRFVDFDR